MGTVHPPFPAYNLENRHVLFPTNTIKSLNTRYQRGHFPTEQTTPKTLLPSHPRA